MQGRSPGCAIAGPGRRRYLTAMDDAVARPDAGAEPIRILIAPDPALRRHAAPVTPSDTETVRALIPRMFASMYAAPGIGLAAPQVGLALRLVVIDLQRDGVREPMVLINPEILARSAETETREEGCLSLPDQYADITRPREIRVRWQDETGARREATADGLFARCIQHEVDHLEGVLFIDHLSALRRNMILRRLAKRQRDKEPGRA